MKKTITLCMLMASMAFTNGSNAQPFTVFASGFSNLIGISRDAQGNLYVAESGSGFNDSKISMITPSASVYSVVTNLPSFLDTTSGEVSGAWRAEMINPTELMVLVGGGTDTNAGSLLFFNVSSFVPGTSSPFTVMDADSIIHISNWVYANGFMDSNPYSSVIDPNGDIYIADAGANAVFKYETTSQTFSVLDTFPAFPNPFPGPPPAFDYVPTRILNDPSGGFLLCNLGSFAPTLGRIAHLTSGGISTVEDSGFTALVDMQYDDVTGDKFVMQFGAFDSSFHPVPGSARIYRIDSTGTVSLADTGFGPSAGFVLDGSGGAYITEIGTGNVLHTSDITGIKKQTASQSLTFFASPNPFTSEIAVTCRQDRTQEADLFVKNLTGETVYSAKIHLTPGENKINWDGHSFNGNELPAGNYFITIKTALTASTIKIVKQ